MDGHLGTVLARVSQLQAHDLPSALQGLLAQAQTALKPTAKSDKGRKAATPAPQKRSLVTAIVLLLDRAGSVLDHDSSLYQAVRAQLLAAFQQHAWLWERLIRVDFSEVLAAPSAAGLLAEVLLLLSSTSQARALNLIRQQLPACVQQPPSAAHCAALQAILGPAFARLKQCFPVVSYSLPGEEAPDDSALPGATQRPSEEGSRVQVELCEQLPALLHLCLALACGKAASPAGQSGSSSSSAGALPASAGSGGSCDDGRSVAVDTSCCSLSAAATGSPGKQAEGRHASLGKHLMPGNTGNVGSSVAASAAAAATIRAGVLRYTALLQQRLGTPDALHETLGLALGGRVAAGADVAGAACAACPSGQGGTSPWLEGPGGGRLSVGDVARVQAVQHTMEALLDGLLTLPDVVTAICQQLHSGSVSIPAPAEQRQRAQARGGSGVGEGGGNKELSGEVCSIVAVLLALNWELTKLRAACSPEAERRSGKAQPAHLSPKACLQLLRLAVSKQHLGVAAGAPMPRAIGGVNRNTQLPPVQLLLPPAVLSHALDLISRALEGGASQAGLKPASSAAAPPASPSGAPTLEDAAFVEELAGRVLEIEQACFQGLQQPWLVLRGPLHKEAISAAARLHSLLTQPQAASAEVIRAAAAAAAAAAACEMGGEEALAEEGNTGARWHRAAAPRKRSLAQSALEGTAAWQLSAKRSRAQQGQQAPRKAGAAGAQLAWAGAPAGEGAGMGVGSWAREPAAAGTATPAGDAVAALLQLFEVRPPQAPLAAKAGGPQEQEGAQVQAGAAAAGLRPRRIAPQPVSSQPVHQQSAKGAQKKRITPVAVQQGPGEAAVQHPPSEQPAPQPAAISAGAAGAGSAHPAQPSSSSLRQGGASAPSIGTTAAVAGAEASAGCEPAAAAPASQSQEQAQQRARQQQQQQQQQGRVYLTATGDLDDAGREALWCAYIADKEYMVEMLGDADYQEWYDEEAHPLPTHTTTLKGVDAMLDEALGSPSSPCGSRGGGEGGQEPLLPRGPDTLLAASVQLPWQAALVACLQLLQRCLGWALGGTLGGCGSGGGAAGPAAGQGEGKGEGDAQGWQLEAAVRLLCGTLGEEQREAAGQAAARAAEPHCGSSTLQLVRRGACSHRLGGALLHFVMQLHKAVGQLTGGRTAPVLLSAYGGLLSLLLPLTQREEEQLAGGPPAGGRKLGKPPLQLLPPVGLQLLEAQQLRPAALSPDSTRCLIQLAQPHQHRQQESLAQHAALLWGLLQRGHSALQGRGRARALSAPLWLEAAPCDLSQVVLLRRGVPPSGLEAAAEEVLWLLAEGAGRLWAGGPLVPGTDRDRELSAQQASGHTAAEAQPTQPPESSPGRQLPGRASGRGKKGEGAAAAGAAAAVAAAGLRSAAAAAAAANAAAASAAGGQAASEGAGVEALLPALDVCGILVQWLVRQQEAAEEMGTEGAVPSGPLSSQRALRELLALCQRLTALCSRALKWLASYMDSLPGGALPAGLGQASALWALSLELSGHMSEVPNLTLPQVLRQSQQALEAALEELSGLQQACAELGNRLPESHPAYAAIAEAARAAPSLYNVGAEETGAGEGEGGGAERGASGGSRSDDDEGGHSAPARGQQARGGGSKQRGGKGGGASKQPAAGGRQRRRRRRRRLQDIRNPFLRAMLAEGGYRAEELEGDDLSDLEDFIVPGNPERDYDAFFAQHFPLARDSSSEDEDEEEGGGEGKEGGKGCNVEAAKAVVRPTGGREEHPKQQQQKGGRRGQAAGISGVAGGPARRTRGAAAGSGPRQRGQQGSGQGPLGSGQEQAAPGSTLARLRELMAEHQTPAELSGAASMQGPAAGGGEGTADAGPAAQQQQQGQGQPALKGRGRPRKQGAGAAQGGPAAAGGEGLEARQQVAPAAARGSGGRRPRQGRQS